MTAASWRYAFASVLGAAHRANGLPCQDSGDCAVIYRADRSPVLVAVASDGAGSASRSQEGSRLACESFVQFIGALVGQGGSASDVTRDFVVRWLRSFIREIEAVAEKAGELPREYACTFLAAVIDHSAAAFSQVGDGAIVISDPDARDEFSWMFWPQHGEYANQTHFASLPDAEKHLDYDLLLCERGAIDEVVLFTDGIERMVLDLAAQAVHGPFFRAILPPLRHRPAGFSLGYSEQLAAFLAGPGVASRGDDDKTIVVATRRADLS